MIWWEPVNRLRAAVGCFLFTMQRLAAQEVILPEQEAPRSLFETGLGDAQVEFFLAGSWTAGLSASTGWLFKPDAVVFPYAFPSLENGLVFQQQPDLTLSVWLRKRFFLEYTVLGSFEKNTFLLGYRGEEGELLQSVAAGNRDVRMDPFRLLDVPDSGSGSLGASARFEMNLPAGPTSHQLLLRYDNDEKGRRVYVGPNLVHEQLVSIAAPAAGRFFLLPDAGVEDLEVFLEDEDGSLADGAGRRYRAATLEDVVTDAAAGRVTLRKATAGAVLVFYRTAYGPVGADGAGTDALVREDPGNAGHLDPALATVDFAWGLSYFGQLLDTRRVTLAGRQYLRLWQPGEFSPFEIQASYAFEEAPPADLDRVRIRVVEQGQPEREVVPQPVRFRVEPGADTFTAWITPDLRGDPRNRYPFLGSALDPDNLLYGPERDPQPGYLSREILVQVLTPVEEYRLEPDILPGSVRVRRNGMEESRFDLEPESGTLTFRTYIHPDDRLEIEYRRRGELLNNGDLLFAWGNRIPLADRLGLEVAAGLRWNFLPGTYAQAPYERTGAVVGSVSLKGEGEALRWAAIAGVAYTNPDTTGVLRLLGMEKAAIEVPLGDETAVPAARPDPADPVPELAGLNNRGALLYKDYRDYGALGSTSLLPYGAAPPASQVFPYASGNRPGPYIAAGNSKGAASGQSLVLDFQLDGTGGWVGAQLPLGGDGPADLSGVRSTFLSYRMVGLSTSGPIQLYLQLGELGEDLDGDDLLDRELSPDSSGWSFDHLPAGPVLKVGGGPKGAGNGRQDTEDGDGNGFLDPEAPARVVTLGSGVNDYFDRITAPGDSAWKGFSGLLDPATRSRLTRSRGARLLVVNQGTGAASGRLLVDRLQLSGSRFWVAPGTFTGTVTTREVEETQAVSAPARTLATAFPEVSGTFHPYGETQKVLEVGWTGGLGGESWSARAFTEAAGGGIGYRTVVCYLRLADLAAASTTLSFTLADAAGKGLAWSFSTPAIPAWSKVEVSPEGRWVRLNGSPVAGASVTVDAGYGSLTTFTVSQSGSTAGLLYLDELHLRDPKGAVGAGLDLDLSLSLPGPLVRIGGLALLSDLTVSQKAVAATEGFSTLYGRPEQERRLSSRTEVSGSLPGVDLGVELLVQGSGADLALSGGHRLTLPNVPFPLTFADTFRTLEGQEGRELYRSNALDLAVPGGSSVHLSASAASRGGTLTQEWSGTVEARLPLGGRGAGGAAIVADSAAEPAADGPPAFSALVRLGLLAAADGFPMTGYPGPEAGYFSSWLQGYRLLLPWEGGSPLERRGNLQSDWRLPTRPLGVEVQGRLDSSSYDIRTAGRSLGSAWLWTLRFPIQLGMEIDRLALVPEYRRKLQLQSAEEGAGDFLSDADRSLSRLGSQTYGFALYPFQELFDPAAEADFTGRSLGLRQALYVPEAVLALDRPFGSRLRDLLLPSRVELGLSKEYRREADLVDFLNRYRLSLQTSAINLFGAFGTRPLVPAYRMDEFGGSLDAAVSTRGDRLHGADLGLEQYASFEGREGFQLTLTHRLQVLLADPGEGGAAEVRDHGEVRCRWRVAPEGGVRLPLLRREIGRTAWFDHEESLQADLEWRPDADSWHPLRLLARHGTSLVLPERGSILAELSLGVDRQAIGRESWISLGVKAMIRAQLQY